MKVSRRRQVTLPVSLCEKYNVNEGDIVEFKETKEGILLEFHPVDAEKDDTDEDEEDESWWLSERWQEGHRRALEDFREGRVSGPFKSGRELMEAIRKQELG